MVPSIIEELPLDLGALLRIKVGRGCMLTYIIFSIKQETSFKWKLVLNIADELVEV